MDELTCIINACDEKADGLVMVNDNKSGLTIFMIPACVAHGAVIKDSPFSINLHLNKDPKVTTWGGEVIPAPKADVTLTYDTIEFGIG